MDSDGAFEISFEHVWGGDVTFDADDDRTLLASDIVLSDETEQDAQLRNMKKTGSNRKQSSCGLIIAIVIASLIFVVSVVVIGVFVRKYKKQKSLESNLLRTARPSSSPSPSFTHTPTNTDISTNTSSISPSISPSAAPTVKGNTTIFYAFGDAPYTEAQAERLHKQMVGVPEDIEFMIHLGDLRKAGGWCEEVDYNNVRKIFRSSKTPMHIIVGDNDVNDCPNPDGGFRYWKRQFQSIPEDTWDTAYQVHRRPDHPEQFWFHHKGALFLGLNLIGGKVHNETGRMDDLEQQWDWVKPILEDYQVGLGSSGGRLVIFAHAEPSSKHDAFFIPFKEYYAAHQEQLALLYLNGDRHEWDFNDMFMGFPNAQQITVSGKAVDPMLKVMIHENRFDFDRRLDAEV